MIKSTLTQSVLEYYNVYLALLAFFTITYSTISLTTFLFITKQYQLFWYGCGWVTVIFSINLCEYCYYMFYGLIVIKENHLGYIKLKKIVYGQ